MGQTLENGIYLPDEGERNCYEGLAANWTALDGMIGGYNVHISNTTIHVTAEDKEAWNGKADASALTAHTGDTTIHVTAEDKAKWDAVTGKADASALTAHTGDTTIHVTAEDKAKWDAVTGKADASALTAHTGDTTIHVTSADKQAWNGKQDALSQTQLDAVNSGIDSTKVQQIATNTSDISSLQSGKANDADVVHKSGNETISGNKTFVEPQYFKDNNVQYFGIDFSKGTAPSAYTARCTYFSPLTDGGSTYQTSNGLIGCGVNSDNIVTAFMHAIKNTVGTTTRTSFILRYDTDNDKRSVTTNGDFLPMLSGQGIGNSTSKWSTINGLNPSSLGMPDLDNGIDISSYLDTSQSSSNYYTPSVNGWISIKGRSGSSNGIAIIQGDFAQSSYNLIDFGSSNRITFCALPVKAGVQVEIWLKSVTTLDFAKFYPCQGNV